MSVITKLYVYLGLPFYKNWLGNSSFKYLADKLNDKLASWKAKALLFVGRSILIKSVAQATPMYVMQTFLLPKHLCAKMDVMMRDFLWGNAREDQR